MRAGVYLGDMHAAQGDGEIAGHTMDVSGSVTLQVEVLKRFAIDGPVLFPLEEDLPPLAKPFTSEEFSKGARLAKSWEIEFSTSQNILKTYQKCMVFHIEDVLNAYRKYNTNHVYECNSKKK